MHANGSLDNKVLFSQRVEIVGSVTRGRIKVDNLSRAIRSFFYAGQYIGFAITFYVLMALNVLPQFSEIDRYNLLEWMEKLPVFKEYVLLFVLLLGIHIFILVQDYLFSGKADRTLVEEYYSLVKSIIYGFLISIGIAFLLKTSTIYSRKTLVLFVLMIIVESLVWKGLQSVLLNYLSKRGLISNRVLIVGAGKVGTEVKGHITGAKNNRNYFVGYLDDYKVDPEIIGKTSDLEKLLQQQRIDIIYITIPSERSIIESILHAVYKYNVDIRIIPEMFDRMSTVFTFRKDLDYPCMQIVKTPLRGINVLLKRLVDTIGSSFLILLLSPVFLIISLWIKIGSEGPVFFRQERIGKNGLPFRMLKFRSMTYEADQLKVNLLHENEATGPVFKLRNDPRITRPGRFLRKYSMDELPQLWNVLKGEMSLIGPRPPLLEEVARYSNYHWRRMDVLPGMTGLWQVSGRSDLSFEEWIELDIYYIERWSFALEMKILLRTIPVVLKGTGAY
jgi:exopolysaccharide biosynthesis polyprenyl glycosylphosphotransferase